MYILHDLTQSKRIRMMNCFVTKPQTAYFHLDKVSYCLHPQLYILSTPFQLSMHIDTMCALYSRKKR